MNKTKISTKINEHDIMKNLRSNSKDAAPSAEFKKELEEKLLADKETFFEQIVSSLKKKRVAYLSSFMTFTILLGATWTFLSKDEPVLQTIIDNKENYISESPYLSQNGIDPETANLMEDIKSDSNGGLWDLFESKDSRSESVEMVYEESSGALSAPSVERAYDLDDSIMPIQISLSGGSVNDNHDFYEFLQYLKDQQFEDEVNDLFAERYLIKVNDQNGKSAPFVEMDIVDESENGYKLHTYSNGEVYFYPEAYQYSNEQQSQGGRNHYEVVIEDESYEFTSDDNIWSIKLDTNQQTANETTLDLVFTIDTTGSMSDQINKLKDTMGSISDDINEKYPNITIRYGLVAYRDISDQYLTEVYDFTTNLDEYQGYLDGLSAAGGGDYEEDMNSALKDTIEDLNWSDDSLKLAFLIADAPPHMDYDQQYTYETAMFRSLELGVKIFPIASSGLDNSHGELILRKVAAVTNAEYMFITNSSGNTDYHVGDDQFQVSNLDGLVLDVISREIDAL